MKQKKCRRQDRTPRIAVAAILALIVPLSGVGGLKNVWLHVPLAVAPGQSATLICHFDLEGEPLYTVKWYKGRQEFFRYVPKEHPHTTLFVEAGISVDIAASGPDRVVIRDVTEKHGGRYRCEVSADAPDFHTQVVSASMHVVHMPEGKPQLRLEKGRYSSGDVLRGNCTSPLSNPPSNITWVINGHKVNSSQVTRSRVGSKYETLGLLEYEMPSLSAGKIKVICIADFFQVFKAQAEQIIDEERPQIASVLGGGGSGLKSIGGICQILLSLVMVTYAR